MEKTNKVVFYSLDGLKGTAGMCVLFVDRSLVVAFVYSIF